MSSPYKDFERKIKLYQKSFCAYFDVLGFKNKIEEDDLKFFDYYLNLLDKVIEHVKAKHRSVGEPSVNTLDIKIFTDNFVIGCPWLEEYGEVELGWIFDVLSYIQYSFAKSSIFIRGAICLSHLYMDENIVLGKALVEAYALETKTAIFPRIILSKGVVDVLKKNIGYYANKKDSPQNRMYLVDKDGVYFVNYLYNLMRVCVDYEGIVDAEKVFLALIEHKEVVVKALKDNNKDHRLFEKFAWVAEYHNYFCDNFFGIINGVSPKQLKEVKVVSKYYRRSISRCVE